MRVNGNSYDFGKIVCTVAVCFFYFTSFAQIPQPGQLSSQPKDTSKFVPVKKVSTRFVTEDEIDRNIALHFIDTNPNGIEIFHNLYKNYTVFQDLGNIGTPSRPLIFNGEKQVGFRLSENPFEGYWMKPEQTKYYNTKTPYSDLFYAQGSNELIYLLARHSQNILPRWNVGADLQRITSIGFLAKQYTSMYNFQFFTRYTSKNRKYDIIANTTWNHGLIEESGGVASDTAFESLTGANKKVTPNLPGEPAIGCQTRFKGRTAFVKQYWHFGQLDQNIKDEDTTYEMNSHSQLSYSIKAEEISYIFENLNGDTNSLLLPHHYYDTTGSTFDSTYYGKIENRIAYDIFNNLKEQIKDSTRTYLGVGISHSAFVTSQYAYVRNYQNIIGDLTFETIHLKNYSGSIKCYAAFNFIGYNAGDYKMKTGLSYRLPSIDAGVDVMSQLYRPDYSMQLYKSNQFIWENSFNRTKVQQIGFHFSTRRFRQNFHLSVNSYALTDWVYADKLGLPAREANTFLVNVIEVKKTFQLWKFYFEHYLIYQNSRSDVIRMPDLSGRIRYYFQSRFKRMKFQMGFDVFYNTAYYANNYNPATRLFFLQNERLVGNYPVIDPFVMGEVKRAIFFAKYEHANQDLFGLNGYYYTPHYPISLSSFRFGIRWRFFD